MFNPELLTTLTTTEVSNPEPVTLDAYDYRINLTAPQMTDNHWNELARELSPYTSIIEKWHCSYIEAIAAHKNGYKSLRTTRKRIAERVTYNRLMKNLYPEALRFITEEQYKDITDKDFLEERARLLTEDEAFMFVYDWKQELDDYNTMTEAEKETAVNEMTA